MNCHTICLYSSMLSQKGQDHVIEALMAWADPGFCEGGCRSSNWCYGGGGTPAPSFTPSPSACPRNQDEQSRLQEQQLVTLGSESCSPSPSPSIYFLWTLSASPLFPSMFRGTSLPLPSDFPPPLSTTATVPGCLRGGKISPASLQPSGRGSEGWQQQKSVPPCSCS